MTSLNARLMVGLLAITAAGLLVMTAVSAIVMREYQVVKLDNELRAERNRAVKVGRAGAIISRFVIFDLRQDGEITTTVSGPGETSAEQSATALGAVRLAALAKSGKPFNLGSTRAIARSGLTKRPIIRVWAATKGQIRASIIALVLTELATTVVLLGLLALLARWLIHRGLAPLSRMATTANHIATNESLLRDRMEGGDDPTEVGRLAGAINVMLDRIEQAFVARLRSESKVREFAADASHELRTPLTTIRGYSELYEQGAVDADEAMRRISGESQRMGRLVEELLELARLDRGSSLTLAWTDLAILAREAVADAAAVEPDRPLTVEAPESLETMVDEGRIRQVLANLLANVRQHTPPGTPAVVRLARSAQWITLDVSDAGPGMPPEDAARAFDRFHRADHNPDGGSGLGMAIIAAIAAAHGGRAMLNVSSGTTVRIELPATTQA
jgi:signal transduction histidine kinase